MSNIQLLIEAHANVTDLTPEEIEARTVAARRALGSDALLLLHHYQRGPVVRFADKTGDSFGIRPSC